MQKPKRRFSDIDTFNRTNSSIIYNHDDNVHVYERFIVRSRNEDNAIKINNFDIQLRDN